MGTILIGTCSWTDKSLIACGRFYPPWAKTPEARLAFYAQEFPIVEVDSTYYALPQRKVTALWAERTPEGFLFDVKAFSLFTQHPTKITALPQDLRQELPASLRSKERLYDKDLPEETRRELWDRFVEALLPLDSAGKLGVVLLQFPPWFYPSSPNREYILQAQERLGQYQGAVEFRCNAWLEEGSRERTLRFLRENHLPFVCVDEPQGFRSSVPPLGEVTAGTALVRFHGRNVETWEKKGLTSSTERFDYYYRDEELQEWVPKLQEMASRARAVHALMNTNKQDQGVVNARRLARLLQGSGSPEVLPAIRN